MKAVILAAGQGKRLRPITFSKPKPMINCVGKPLLDYAIMGLKAVGINNILIIVGYKEEQIRDYFSKRAIEVKINIEFITQNEYLGTAHATSLARKYVGEDDFLLMYGDLIVDPTVYKQVIDKYNDNDVDGVISLIEVSNPQEYGIITIDSNGNVKDITEKPPPELGLGNLGNAGIYIFNSSIFKAIEKTKKSVRAEYEFTDSMKILINELNGKIIGYDIKKHFWNDIGLPWQLFDVNKYILDNLKKEIKGKIEPNVNILGNIYIGGKTIIKSGTYIQGPCYIGENNIIGPNAFIRPYTVIEDNCHIGMSEIKNSIIFSNSSIPHFNYVGDSIICEKVNLGAGTKLSNLRFDNKTIKMNINGKLIDSGRRKLGAIIGPESQTGINASIMCGKKVGENSIIGAHTLVNEDIPPNTLYFQDTDGNIIKKSNPIC
jgi:UDP-N-acetylglucosamine diphosphorylase/glucosamine-1-phosphate N-acetyltransferase